MTRDARIADLAVHGWRPVFNITTGRHGIYNDDHAIGFSVRNETGDSEAKRFGKGHALASYRDCPWDEVTDWHLDRIEERLRAA